MIDTILQATELVRLLNVGAAILPSSEVPIYQSILEAGKAELFAFEGDERQLSQLQSEPDPRRHVFSYFLHDGQLHKLYVFHPDSGLTSILQPDLVAMSFFNGFAQWGTDFSVSTVQTARLDDLAEVPDIDFAKLDVQGAELAVLKNGMHKLRDCVAIQLEVSFVTLYREQPPFGEVDQWLRQQGFVPHRFVHVKPWSIAPIVFNGDVRVAGHQLLEADVIYVRQLLALEKLSAAQLRKLAVLAHYCFKSFDLCGRIIRELSNKGELPASALVQYVEHVASNNLVDSSDSRFASMQP